MGNYELPVSRWWDGPQWREGWIRLLVQLEDANLHQFADGKVVQPASSHALNKLRSHLEDAHLDQLIERGFVAQRANLFDLYRIHLVHPHRDQLFRRRSRIPQRCHALNISGIDFEYLHCNQVVRVDTLDA